MCRLASICMSCGVCAIVACAMRIMCYIVLSRTMKFKNIYILIALLALPAVTMQARMLKGIISDAQGETIIGAEVFWLNTNIGAVSDVDGAFAINTTRKSNQLVVSYVSYQNDTILVDDPTATLQIVLREDSKALDEVVVRSRKMSTIASRFDPIQTTKITGEELCKAACCNLSESFETNASVDVSYADAATGAKQIKLLGLSGTYVQLLTENSPGVRGLAASYGMEYIPGPWMESIQVSKGTSSVINGYEATTGQINVEYLKPQTSDPIALNFLTNSSLGAELNATGGWDVNDKLSTGVLLYVKNNSLEHDSNKDGFNDLPLVNQYNLVNRWYYKTDDYTGQFFVKGLYDDRRGGQIKGIDDPYKIGIRTMRGEAFMKHGFVFDHERGTSIGLIFSGSYHDQQGQYGNRHYTGRQGNAYFNGIFQTNFGDAHKLVTGLSFNFDDYSEVLTVPVAGGSEQTHSFVNREYTPGVFAEYSFNYHEHLSLLAGVRADYSSRFGAFVTPRFNVRYSPFEWWNVRGSVGLGYRSPNVIADNSFMLPSSRKLTVIEPINQESALNAGVSTTFYIPISGRELQITGEYYYTHFMESMVVDMDSDPHGITISNLNGGRSYAGNFQVEASMEILKGWTMTLAHRMTDVRTTIGGELREKVLSPRFKSLLTTSYQTPLKRWQFDVTAQLNGGGRMPDPDPANPLWERTFPMHPQLMAQVTRYFRTWSIYIGGENITNFTQPNPIVDAENPFGSNFDASMAWGPIHGAKVYLGMRWALDRKEE